MVSASVIQYEALTGQDCNRSGAGVVYGVECRALSCRCHTECTVCLVLFELKSMVSASVIQYEALTGQDCNRSGAGVECRALSCRCHAEWYFRSVKQTVTSLMHMIWLTAAPIRARSSNLLVSLHLSSSKSSPALRFRWLWRARDSIAVDKTTFFGLVIMSQISWRRPTFVTGPTGNLYLYLFYFLFIKLNTFIYCIFIGYFWIQKSLSYFTSKIINWLIDLTKILVLY